MAWTRAALGVVAVAAVALVLVSGGSDADPRTPAALPGQPAPFLGTAVAGSGELTAAVDAYGDVVDLRRSPAGPALIDNPANRQAAGTVPADTGIVPRVSIDGGPALAFWRADSVSQRYLPGTNVVRTVARFGAVAATVTVAAAGRSLAVVVSAEAPAGTRVRTSVGVDTKDRRGWRLCLRGCAGLIRAVAHDDRRWLARGRPLRDAPRWARRMYARSLLTLRALTDRRTGAVAAGARDGWAYVWPRDAATAALALEAAGYRRLARHVVGFFAGAGLFRAARFYGNGAPVPGRGAQGDAPGWLTVAAPDQRLAREIPGYNRERLPDYQEGGDGDYLGNMISMGGDYASLGLGGGGLAGPIRRLFATPEGLVREADDPASGLDSAAAWAVRPFPIPPLYPLVRRTLLNLAGAQTRYGITPGTGWGGGSDPWTAPTAWSAWSLAALAASEAAHAPRRAGTDRRAALALLADLRRAATPAGAIPERVDARTGIPRSTTPLAWSHAFAILALRELWPATAGASG